MTCNGILVEKGELYWNNIFQSVLCDSVTFIGIVISWCRLPSLTPERAIDIDERNFSTNKALVVLFENFVLFNDVVGIWAYTQLVIFGASNLLTLSQATAPSSLFELCIEQRTCTSPLKFCQDETWSIVCRYVSKAKVSSSLLSDMRNTTLFGWWFFHIFSWPSLNLWDT